MLNNAFDLQLKTEAVDDGKRHILVAQDEAAGAAFRVDPGIAAGSLPSPGDKAEIAPEHSADSVG